jgi:hypothetical protein
VEVFNIQVDKPSAAVQAPVLHAWDPSQAVFQMCLIFMHQTTTQAFES